MDGGGTYLGLGEGYLPWLGRRSTYLGWDRGTYLGIPPPPTLTWLGGGVPTLDGEGVPTLDGEGIPTLDGGGVPTLDGEGVPTLDGGGIPTLDGGGVPTLEYSRPDLAGGRGTYLGQGGGVPTLGQGRRGTYLGVPPPPPPPTRGRTHTCENIIFGCGR